MTIDSSNSLSLTAVEASNSCPLCAVQCLWPMLAKQQNRLRRMGHVGDMKLSSDSKN